MLLLLSIVNVCVKITVVHSQRVREKFPVDIDSMMISDPVRCHNSRELPTAEEFQWTVVAREEVDLVRSRLETISALTDRPRFDETRG